MPLLRRLLDTYRGTSLPPNVRRLGVASFFQDVASEMVYPLLPAFLASLGGGAAVLGAMEALSEGILALVKGAAGRASDRLGRRKPFVAAGYGLSALARPLLPLAMSTWQVVALRGWDRLAKGVRTAPRDALIAESTPPAHRAYAFSFHRGLDHLGAAVGPLLAAGLLVVAPGNLHLVFALATLPALVGWGTVHLGLREPAPAVAARCPPPRDVRPARQRRLAPELRPLLVAFTLFALANASDAFLLLRAGELGLGAAGLALLWSAFHLLRSALSAPAGRLADRIGRRRSLVLGWTAYAASYFGFASTAQPGLLALLLLPYAFAYAVTEGAERALVSAIAGDGALGTGLGAFHLVTGLGTLGASLWFGAVWQVVSPSAAFGTGAVLAIVGVLALVLAKRPSTAAQR